MARTGLLNAKNKNTIDYSGLGAVGTQHFLGHRIGAIGLDASRNTYLNLTSILNQQLIGSFSGATVGSGVTMTSSVTKAFGVYADDGGAAIGSGTFARAIVGRHLLTYTTGNREQEAAGVVGQIVSSEGTNRHNMCGVMGSYEARTSLTIDGQINSTDTWCQAGVIGRVGGASMTIANYGVLAGVAAMSNITSGQLTNSAGGVYAAFYAGAWAGTTDWQWGLVIEGPKVSNGIAIGTSTFPVTLAAAANFGFQLYTTCASAHASNSVEPFYMKSTMTGPAGVGGRARFHCYTNVALGAWCNPLKGHMEFGASGRVTGLASAMCAELLLSAGCTQGTYCALEAELVADSAVATGTATAFLYCNIAGTSGTGITTINTNGYFFIIGDGIADTNDGMFEAETIAGVDATHVLRVKIDGTDYWMALHTAKGMA